MYSAKDELKYKLEKLMSNPDKPVEIPQRKDKKISEGPDFVRNIMGSSAGANSGDFFVFNNLRRKEYARQKIIEIEAKNESLNEDYHKKLEENKRLAEERTAKKRNKRLKKKGKNKKICKETEKNRKDSSDERSVEESEEEEDNDKKYENKDELKDEESKNEKDEEKKNEKSEEKKNEVNNEKIEPN